MTINYKELVLHQGTDFSIELDVVNEYGEPYDLDAYDFVCVARPSYYSERRPLEFNIEKIDKETGTIKMSVEHSSTEHLVNPKLVYTLYSKNIENMSIFAHSNRTNKLITLLNKLLTEKYSFLWKH